MSYLWNIESERWPVTRFAMDCGTPPRIMFRAAVRRRSWKSFPETPAAVLAAANWRLKVGGGIRFPLRWKTYSETPTNPSCVLYSRAFQGKPFAGLRRPCSVSREESIRERDMLREVLASFRNRLFHCMADLPKQGVNVLASRLSSQAPGTGESRGLRPPYLAAALNGGGQNRASLFVPFSAIQKLTPSLQAPNGNVLTPVAKEPSVVRSAAFQSETLLPIWFVTRMRCPSNAAVEGAFSPLPVRVASTAPLEARTTENEAEPPLGAQMFVPSKIGILGKVPTETVCGMAPEPSSFRRVPAVLSVTQTFAPS